MDEDARALTLEFLEREFMKNKASYKAAAYQDRSLQDGFWNGQAVDKQLNNVGGHLSDYWISDFLRSELRVTSAAGTRRLAVALRDAARKAPLPIKQDLPQLLHSRTGWLARTEHQQFRRAVPPLATC